MTHPILRHVIDLLSPAATTASVLTVSVTIGTAIPQRAVIPPTPLPAVTVAITPSPSPSPEPTPTPTPAPTPDPTDLFDKHFGKEAHIARAIAKAENRSGDPKAMNTNRDYSGLPNKPWKQEFPNGSEDYGLMQINLFWNWEKVPGRTKAEKITWIQNPNNNIKLAKQIRDSWGNYSAWSTYKNGKYKQYLRSNL